MLASPICLTGIAGNPWKPAIYHAMYNLYKKTYNLTERVCVIDPEAAKDPVHIPCVSESIAPYNHLKGLYERDE